MSNTRRSGFGRADLIVCLVIGFFAFSLLAPAILRARYKAQQSSTAFDIHRIETAVFCVEEELRDLDLMEEALNNPESAFRRECELKNSVEETRKSIAQRRLFFQEELRKLRIELVKAQNAQKSGTPYRLP
jgi:hypothetical protein